MAHEYTTADELEVGDEVVLVAYPRWGGMIRVTEGYRVTKKLATRVVIQRESGSEMRWVIDSFGRRLVNVEGRGSDAPFLYPASSPEVERVREANRREEIRMDAQDHARAFVTSHRHTVEEIDTMIAKLAALREIEGGSL